MRVGAEDESEAVGDAQQVGFFPLFITWRTEISVHPFICAHERGKKHLCSVASAGILSDMCASTPAPW